MQSSFLTSYRALFDRLLPGAAGFALADAGLQAIEGCGSLADTLSVGATLKKLPWATASAKPQPAALRRVKGVSFVAIPLMDSTGDLVLVVCVEVKTDKSDGLPAHVVMLLKPALDCLQREYGASRQQAQRVETATERTQDLEWLFHVTADLKKSSADVLPLNQLLTAATERLDSVLGALVIPDKQLMLTHARDNSTAGALRDVFAQTQPHLLAWASRRREPLMVNEPPRTQAREIRARMLSVPIQSTSGRVIGILAFYNAMDARPFGERQQFMAGHIAQQVTHLVEAQFDMMTGLPTRAALEQHFEQRCVEQPDLNRSLVYVDIAQLHVCNERQGFEIGDELIVRIADILCSSLVPKGSLVGRISGDRFAIILESCEPKEAVEFTSRLHSATNAIRIGSPEEPFEASVSCGIAAIVAMPKGFARALAAAEIACKAAKDRGRGRTELYACEDASMMRRHDDVIAVGHLRDAIRSERLVLFAQPIVALRDTRPIAGFEILVRMREADGTLTQPSKFMSAAQRYQLLPQIDRYVVRQTLAIVSPYRALLRERAATVSINVSGQSLGDDTFIDDFLAQITRSQVGPGMITCEITEQTAVASLAKAADLMRRLRKAGCRVALDDFGIGANSLAYLKGLPATRIKIDGSFIKDLITNPRSRAMVTSLVTLAKQFDMDTVAEYVESEELAETLAQIGVDYAQGYLFGQPEPLEQLLRTLQSEESQRLRAVWLAS